MNGYLRRLAARAVGTATVAKPLLGPLFDEAAPALAGTPAFIPRVDAVAVQPPATANAAHASSQPAEVPAAPVRPARARTPQAGTSVTLPDAAATHEEPDDADPQESAGWPHAPPQSVWPSIDTSFREPPLLDARATGTPGTPVATAADLHTPNDSQPASPRPVASSLSDERSAPGMPITAITAITPIVSSSILATAAPRPAVDVAGRAAPLASELAPTSRPTAPAWQAAVLRIHTTDGEAAPSLAGHSVGPRAATPIASLTERARDADEQRAPAAPRAAVPQRTPAPVHVTIGRVEVRAVVAPPTGRPARGSAATPAALEDVLRRRQRSAGP